MQILLRQIHFQPSLGSNNNCTYIDTMQLYLVTTNLLVCKQSVKKLSARKSYESFKIVFIFQSRSELKRLVDILLTKLRCRPVLISVETFLNENIWWETLSSAESFQKMMHHYGWAICLSYTMKMWKRVPLDIAGIRHNDFKSFVLQMERAFLRFCHQNCGVLLDMYELTSMTVLTIIHAVGPPT